MHRPPKTEISEEEKVQYNGLNILLEVEKCIKPEFAASWLLARLWNITNGAIVDALSTVNEKGVGYGDGGDFYAYLLVENASGALGVLEIRGAMNILYGSINLVRRSEAMKAEEMEAFYRSLGNILLNKPNELAVCSITIKDPEKRGYPFTYGWDGQKFLKYCEDEVLQWYPDNNLCSLRALVEIALKSLEQHPLHHLERGIREAIIDEISVYIRNHCKFAITRPVSRQQLELATLSKVLYLWKETWPNNNKIDVLMEKFYKVKEATNEETAEQIMSSWEEDWNFIKKWTEQTYIKDIQHKVHRFPQAMVGLAVMRGLKASEEELFKYKHIKKDIEEKKTINFKEALNIDYNKVDIFEEFYEEDMYFYAACAYAGGTPYSTEGFEIGDIQKYDEFWRWWLLEAICL